MTSPATKNKVPFLQKRWLRRSLIAAVFVILLLIGIPLALKLYLVSWFEKNGADRAAISSLWLNPFLGRLQLKGVDVETGGVSLLHDGAMEIDVSLGALFRKEFRLEKVLYHDLQLVVEELDDGGYRLASYTMLPAAGEPAAVSADSTEDVAGAWAFLADQVNLSHCLLTYKSSKLELHLAIDEAALSRLSTRPEEQAGTLLLKGSINGKKLSLDLTRLALAPELELAGSLQLEDFNLDDLDRLLAKALPVFGGHAGIDGNFTFTAQKDETLLVGWNGTIAVAEPKVGNQDFGVNAGKLSYAGKAEVTLPATAPMEISVDGTLGSDGLHVEVPGARLTTEEKTIRIGGKTTVVIGDEVRVQQSGGLHVGATTVVVQDQHVGHESLDWQGEVTYVFSATGVNTVRTAGKLQVAGSGYQADEINIGSGTLVWQGDIAYLESAHAPAVVTAKGNLDAAGTSLAIARTLIGLDSTTLESDLELSLADEFGVSGSGRWHGEQLQLAIDGEDPFRLDVGTMDISDALADGGRTLGIGGIDIDDVSASVGGTLPLAAQLGRIRMSELKTDNWLAWRAGTLTMTEVKGKSLRTDSEIFHLGSSMLEDLRVDEQAAVAAGQVTLQDFRFLGGGKDTQPPLALNGASFTKLGFDLAGGLACENIAIDGIAADFKREKDGEFRIAKQLSAMQRPAPAADEQTQVVETTGRADEQNAGGIPIRIGEVTATGKNSIRFQDNTLAEPFATRLNIDKLTVGPLDSTRLEEETTVLLDGNFEGRAPLHIAGTVSPFLPKIGANLEVSLKNYPLSNLSSYTVENVGTGLASGQLQLKTEFSLANDTLDMKNDVLLKKLETKNVAPELAEKLDNKLPIPLDAALAVLRDSERNISLSIPLSGPLSDLNVGLSDIIITALGKAIVPAASGYLVYALGPYGALAYVGMKVGEKMLQINLPPISFATGSGELGDHGDYLQRVGKILAERPETDLQISPQVGAWELFDEQGQEQYRAQPMPLDPELRERILALGEQRGQAIKTYLVDQLGIDASRLFISDTLVIEDPKQDPKVLLQM